MNFPNYQWNEACPALKPPGIVISAPPRVSLGAGTLFPVYGSFAVPKTLAEEFDGHLFQSVVILLRGPYPATRNVGHGEVLFPDDLVEAGEYVRGYFSLNLFDLFGLVEEPNRYWVSASTFGYVSDILTVDVAP